DRHCPTPEARLGPPEAANRLDSSLFHRLPIGGGAIAQRVHAFVRELARCAPPLGELAAARQAFREGSRQGLGLSGRWHREREEVRVRQMGFTPGAIPFAHDFLSSLSRSRIL